jgi:hypothetical protein
VTTALYRLFPGAGRPARRMALMSDNFTLSDMLSEAAKSGEKS